MRKGGSGGEKSEANKCEGTRSHARCSRRATCEGQRRSASDEQETGGVSVEADASPSLSLASSVLCYSSLLLFSPSSKPSSGVRLWPRIDRGQSSSSMRWADAEDRRTTRRERAVASGVFACSALLSESDRRGQSLAVAHAGRRRCREGSSHSGGREQRAADGMARLRPWRRSHGHLSTGACGLLLSGSGGCVT